MTKRTATMTVAPCPRLSRTERRAGTDRRQGRRPSDRRSWVVINSLPANTPVFPAEIDVIETYLGELLNNLLGACRAN